jgi:hypothetical protein
MPTEDPQSNPQKTPMISPWVKGPLFMYLTIVIAFAIIAVFVFRYVLSLGASAR